MPIAPMDDYDARVYELLGLPPPSGAGRLGVEPAPPARPDGGEAATKPEPASGLEPAGQDEAIDPLQVARWAAGIVLAATLNDEQPEQQRPPPVGLECPVPSIGLREPVKRAVQDLGLPVQDAVPADRPQGFVPPGLLGAMPRVEPRIVVVPEAALWVGDSPSPLLGAVAESLGDPTMMSIIRSALDAVRFGRDAASGRRPAEAHAVEVKSGHRDVFLSSRLPDPGPAMVRCSCALPDAGPLPALEALTLAAVHVRMEIEEQLRQLWRMGPGDPGERNRP